MNFLFLGSAGVGFAWKWKELATLSAILTLLLITMVILFITWAKTKRALGEKFSMLISFFVPHAKHGLQILRFVRRQTNPQ